MSSLNSGLYVDSIEITSNDPLNPFVVVPIVIDYVGAPEIVLSDTCINSDTIFQWTSTTNNLYIKNTGCDTLSVTNIVSSSAEFSVDTTTLTIMPGDSSLVIITFSPVTPGSYSEILTIFNNDIDTTICLTGYALSPPIISYDPDSFDVLITTCADSVTLPLTVYNSGTEDLIFNITKQGYSTSLDGSGDYISIPDNNLWTFAGDFTISLWVKANSWGGNWYERAFLGHDNGGGAQDKLIFSYNGGTQLHLNYPGGPAVYITGNAWTPNPNVWYFITVTRSGNTYKFYRDGIFDGSVINSNPIPNSTVPLTIGWAEGASSFNGLIDEVRIWNYARTGIEVNSAMNLTLTGSEQGLIGYWNFDDQSADDLSANGNDGTFTGDATTDVPNAPVPDWLSFTLVPDTVVTGDSSIIDINFYSDGLITGTYTSEIIINSNDPLSSLDTIPCTIEVQGYPVVASSDTCLDLDSIMQYTTNNATMTVYNNGCDTLFVDSIINLLSEYSIDTSIFTLLPGDSVVVTVTFSPTTAGTFDDTLTVFNNDTIMLVCLTSISYPPPSIAVNPDTMDVTITGCMDSIIVPLTIYNNGGSELIFDIPTTEYCALFDASNEYIQVPTVALPASYTLEAWGLFPLAVTGQWRTLYQTGASQHHILVQVDGMLGVYNGGFYSCGFDVDLLTPGWHFITAVGSGSQTEFFIDGNPVGVSSTKLASGINYLGNYVGGGQYFGKADEFRIWNYGRIQSEILNSMNSSLSGAEPGLLGYWNFDDQTATDLSPNGNDGTLVNGASIVPVNGPVSMISFNPETDTVAASDSILIDVLFDGTGILPGTYYDSILINSNDPLIPQVVVPTSFTITPIPNSPVTSDTTICFNNPTPDLVATGSNIQWYDTIALDSVIFSGSSFASGDTAVGIYTYYVTQTIDSCESPADSAVLTINIGPSIPVALDTSICDGDATPDLTVAGTFIKWYDDILLDSVIFSGSQFATGETAIGIYTYYVTDSVVGCPATSADTSVLAINPIPLAPIASDTAICFGDSTPDFIAVGNNIQWYDDPTLISPPVFIGDSFASGDTVIGIHVYYATQTVLGCESPSDTVTLAINGVPTAPPVSDNTICFGEPTPDFIASGTYVQWYDDSALTNLLFLGDSFACGETAVGVYPYYVTDSLSGCPAGPSDTVSLTIFAIPAAPIASDTEICLGDTTPDLTAIGANIQWYDDTLLTIPVFIGDTFATGETSASIYTYYATQTVNGCESPADTVILAIYSTPVPTSSDTIICFGDPTPDLVATGTAIQWYDDPLPDTVIYSGTPFASGDTAIGTYTYYVTQTLNNCESPATTVLLTINTGPAVPSASDTAICFGDATPDLIATGTNIQWYDDPLPDSVIYSGSPFATGETAVGIYTYYVSDSITSCPEGPVDTVTLTIFPIPVAPTSSDTTICFGSPTPDLSVSGSNILWYSDPLLDTLVFAGDPFASGDTAEGVYTYYATQTENNCESPATTVVLTINTIPSQPVASDETICFGESTPDLVTTGTNIQWYNDTNLSTLIYSGSPFTTGETVAGIYTYFVTDSITNCPQSAADTVILTINALPPMPIASDTAICYGDITPDLVAIGDSIQWYYDTALTSIAYTGDTFATGDTSVGMHTYYVTQTNLLTLCEGPADTVTLTINATPPPAASDITMCYGDPTPDLTATGTNIQWYDNALLDSVIFNGSPFASGDTAVSIYIYYVTQTLNNCESPEAIVTLTISNQPALPVTSADTAICFGDITPGLTAAGTYIQWYNDTLLDTVLFTGSPFATGETAIGTYTYYVTDSVPGCGESAPDTVILTINVIPSLPISSDTTICFGDSIPDLVATGSNIQWYDNVLLDTVIYSGSSFASGDSAVGVYTYYATQTVSNCESPATTVTLSINAIPPVPIASDILVCFGDPVPDLTATGTNVQWYDAAPLPGSSIYSGNSFATGDTALGVYYYWVTDSIAGCVSPENSVTLTIGGLPILTLSDTCVDLGSTVQYTTNTAILDIINTGCDTLFITNITNSLSEFSVDTTALAILPGDSGQIIVSFTPTSDTSFADTLNIFSNDVDTSVCLTGSGLGAPVVFTDPDSFNISLNGCCNSTTLPLTVFNNGSAGALDLAFTVSSDSSWISFTITADSVAVGDSSIIDVTFDGCGLTPGTYTPVIVISSNDPLNPSDTVSVTVVKNPLPTSPIASNMAVCIGDSVPSLIATGGATILWYNDAGLTNLVFVGDTFATGDTTVGLHTYYITSMVDSCESLPDSVTLEINTPPTAPVVSDTTACSSEAIPDLIATGTFVQWYSDTGLTTLIYSGDAFPTGETTAGVYTYYVTDSTGGCAASPADTVTLTIIPAPAAPVASADTTICYGDPSPVFFASGDSILWHSDSLLATIIFSGDTFTPTDTTSGIYTYYVTQTDTSISDCKSLADTVTFIINAIPAAPVTSGDTTICLGNPTPDLIATGTYLQWYDDTMLTNLVFAGDTFQSGVTALGVYTYYITDSVASCSKGPAATVVLSINSLSIAPTATDTAVCFGDSIPALITSGTYINWYSDSSLSNLVFSGDTFPTGDSAVGIYTYYLTDSIAGCPASPADTAILTINAILPAPIANDTTICFGELTPDLVATGVGIRWYNDSLLDTLVFAGDTFPTGDTITGIYTYYATQTDTLTNCESPADTVILTINPIPSAPTSTGGTECEGNPIPDLTATGTNIQWYSDTALSVLEFSGDIFATGQTLAGTYTYYVTQTLLGCESPADTAVLTIMQTPLAPIASDESACEGGTVPDLTAIGINIQWYDNLLLDSVIYTGSPFATGETAAGIYAYYVTDSLPGCPGPATTVTLTINTMPGAPTASDTTICYGEPTPDLISTGTNAQWYKDPTLLVLVYSGNTFATGVTAVGTYTWYVTQTASGCGESPADTVSLTINPKPLVTLNTYSVPIALGDSVTLIAYNASTYSWLPPAGLNTDTGFTVIASPDTTTTYTVTGINDWGCSNDASVIVIVKGTWIDENTFVQNLSIYPNPTRDEFVVDFISSQDGLVEINLQNSLGQILIIKEIESDKGHHYIQSFDVKDLGTGIYNLQIVTDSGIINSKVVVFRN
ncbi:MAG: LamG-like jellyroll fold domain-containing protein [Bacteroidota bacterium]